MNRDIYDALFDALHGQPRRHPGQAQRCRCVGGPMVDRNDNRHGVITCFRCGKRPADKVLARQGRRPA